MSSNLLESPPDNASLPSVESERQRRCTRCHRWLPIEQFRFALRRIGKRHTKCTACEVELERARRIGRRSKRLYAEFLSESRRKYTATMLAELCQEMVDKYGGIAKFARRWHEATEFASQSGRTATTLRSYTLLIRLWAAHDELAPKISELTDAELAALKEQSVIQLIMQRPALAVAACRQMGWIVVPVAYGNSDQEKDGV